MVRRLREIETTREDQTIGSTWSDQQDARLEEAFRAYGLDLEAMEPEEGGAALRTSAIHPELLRALESWVFHRRRRTDADETEWTHLAAVADAADPDPWAVKIRRAALERDVEALRRAAQDDEALKARPERAVALASWLSMAGEPNRALELVEALLVRHPDDLRAHWLALNLSSSLDQREQVRRHAVVGLALEPDSLDAYLSLSGAHQGLDDYASAIAWSERALTVDPEALDAVSQLVAQHRTCSDRWIRRWRTGSDAWRSSRTRPGSWPWSDPPTCRRASRRRRCPRSSAWSRCVPTRRTRSAYSPAPVSERGNPSGASSWWPKRPGWRPGKQLALEPRHADGPAPPRGWSDPRRGRRTLREASARGLGPRALPVPARIRLPIHWGDASTTRWRRAGRRRACSPSRGGPTTSCRPFTAGSPGTLRRPTKRPPGPSSSPRGRTCSATSSGSRRTRLGKVEEALAHLAEAVKRSAAFGQAHLAWIWILALEGRGDEAVAHYEARVADHPSGNDRTCLGVALLRAGRPDDAAEVLAKVWREDPGMVGAASWPAIAYYRAGRAEEAVPVLEDAIRRRPVAAQGGAYSLLADLHLRRGEPEEARAVYLAALRQGGEARSYNERHVAFAAACCEAPAEAEAWCEARFPSLGGLAPAHIRAASAKGGSRERSARGHRPDGGSAPARSAVPVSPDVARQGLPGPRRPGQGARRVLPQPLLERAGLQRFLDWRRRALRESSPRSRACVGAGSTRPRASASRIAWRSCVGHDAPPNGWPPGPGVWTPCAARGRDTAGHLGGRSARDALDAAEFARCSGAYAQAAGIFGRLSSPTCASTGGRDCACGSAPRVRPRAAAAAEGVDAETRKSLQCRRAGGCATSSWSGASVWQSVSRAVGSGVSVLDPELWHWEFHVDLASVRDRRGAREAAGRGARGVGGSLARGGRGAGEPEAVSVPASRGASSRAGAAGGGRPLRAGPRSRTPCRGPGCWSTPLRDSRASGRTQRRPRTRRPPRRSTALAPVGDQADGVLRARGDVERLGAELPREAPGRFAEVRLGGEGSLGEHGRPASTPERAAWTDRIWRRIPPGCPRASTSTTLVRRPVMPAVKVCAWSSIAHVVRLRGEERRVVRLIQHRSGGALVGAAAPAAHRPHRPEQARHDHRELPGAHGSSSARGPLRTGPTVRTHSRAAGSRAQRTAIARQGTRGNPLRETPSGPTFRGAACRVAAARGSGQDRGWSPGCSRGARGPARETSSSSLGLMRR